MLTFHDSVVYFRFPTAGQFKMCPLCDYCNYWYLDTICAYAKIAYLFDHPGTVFYRVFVSFWGEQSAEFWVSHAEIRAAAVIAA